MPPFPLRFELWLRERTIVSGVDSTPLERRQEIAPSFVVLLRQTPPSGIVRQSHKLVCEFILQAQKHQRDVLRKFRHTIPMQEIRQRTITWTSHRHIFLRPTFKLSRTRPAGLNNRTGQSRVLALAPGWAVSLFVLGHGDEPFRPVILPKLIFLHRKSGHVVGESGLTACSFFCSFSVLSGLVNTDELRVFPLLGNLVRVPKYENALHLFLRPTVLFACTRCRNITVRGLAGAGFQRIQVAVIECDKLESAAFGC